jgi:hypothetical protein
MPPSNTYNPPYQNTTVSPTGGTNAFGGSGMNYEFTLAPVTAGSEVTLTLTDQLTGPQTQVGAGNVTGTDPSFIFTFNQKVYTLAGSTAYFCALDEPTLWNDPNGAGNGFITMSNYYSTNEPLAAIAPYQGRLLFCFRRLVQIWYVDPDPANNALTQTLPNIGTVAPLSVQPVGDMDVYMLADNGVRSVRVRDASNNALIADVGTPIDAILQPLLAALTDAQKAAACGIVEPSSNRYWLYLPQPDGNAGKIYVFSYFPSSQIAAWGSYSPTYQVAVPAPAATYPATGPFTVTYTGLTVGQRYAWLPGANEVTLTCGTQILKGEGAFVATVTAATVTGNAASAAYSGALSATTTFVPTKFVVYNGQVWARAGALLFQFGGPNNQAYDNCGVTFITPYIDGGEPATRKNFESIDAGFQGTWQIFGSQDYVSQGYKLLYNNTASSFQYGAIGWGSTGTHYSFQGVEAGSGYALFSSIINHAKPANEK